MSEDEPATDYLREHDAGTTARERGYSHGQLPGTPKGAEVLHLTPEHWANVGGFRQAGEISDEERDEERRAAGAYSDERPDGDIVITIRLGRGINPRAWLSGWDEEAKAAYLERPEQSSGEWNDQAWKRYIRAKARRLPPMIPCAECARVFQPERMTATYCSGACRSRAKRARERHANSGAA